MVKNPQSTVFIQHDDVIVMLCNAGNMKWGSNLKCLPIWLDIIFVHLSLYIYINVKVYVYMCALGSTPSDAIYHA